jgi:hypothetical protein
MLAIADMAGPQWSSLARAAAVQLSSDSESEPTSPKLRLLADIRGVFEELGVDRLLSEALVVELIKDPNGPWLAYGRSGKPITQRQVAALLGDFTKPRSIRTSSASTGPRRGT